MSVFILFTTSAPHPFQRKVDPQGYHVYEALSTMQLKPDGNEDGYCCEGDHSNKIQ
jgi:hypothetical protein